MLASAKMSTPQTRVSLNDLMLFGNKDNSDNTPSPSDVRAKQRLCYYAAWFLSAGLVAVSRHVISAVRPLPLSRRFWNFTDNVSVIVHGIQHDCKFKG